MNEIRKVLGDLAPCPFCGHASKLTSIRDGKRVECPSCLCAGPAVFHGRGGWDACKADAIAAWNKRAESLLQSLPDNQYGAADWKDAPVGGAWYLASLNDGLFIINQKPSPAGTDIPVGCGTMNPSIVLNVTELSQDKAKAIVDAHNAIRATADLIRERGGQGGEPDGISEDANVYRDELLATEANLIQIWQALGIPLEPLRTVHARAMDRIRKLWAAAEAARTVEMTCVRHDGNDAAEFRKLDAALGELVVRGSGTSQPAVAGEAAAWQYRLHFLNEAGGSTEWAECSPDFSGYPDHADLVRFEKRALYCRPQSPTVPDDVMAAAESVHKALTPFGGLLTQGARPIDTVMDWLKSTNAAAAKDRHEQG